MLQLIRYLQCCLNCYMVFDVKRQFLASCQMTIIHCSVVTSSLKLITVIKSTI